MQALRGKTPLELAALAMGEESTLRCRARHEPCPGEAKKLLKEMDEGTALWYGLRRHLDEESTLEALREMSEFSTWKETKATENEQLRKQYLRLFQAVKEYDPGFVDHAMQARREAKKKEEANARGSASA